MITDITKHFILLFTSLMLLSGCVAEDDIVTPSTVLDNYIKIPRVNSVQELGISSKDGWTIVSSPEWLATFKDGDSKDKNIRIVSETNYEEADRSGDVKIINANGKEQTVHVIQCGLLSEPLVRGEISQADLTSTNGVGFGTNVFLSAQSAKYRVSALSPFSLKALYGASTGDIKEIDAYTMEDRAYSTVETLTGNSVQNIANQLSVNAGVEAAIGAWTLSVSGGFNAKTDEHHKNFYALQEVKHIVKSGQFRGGFLKYISQDSEYRQKYMDHTFLAYADSIAKLNNTTKLNETLRMLVDTYGTHIITYGELGAELQFKMTIQADSSQNETVINAAVDLGNKAFAAGGKFNYDEKDKVISKNTNIQLVTYGGDNVFGANPASDLEYFYTNIINKENQEAWIEPVKNRHENMALIGVQLMPIYELMPTQLAKDRLRNYIIGPYQKEVMEGATTDYTGTQVYKINNFFTNKKFIGEQSITIPSLDMEIVARRDSFPELSKTEYSTVIYSGPIGQVNRSSGFFIGSESSCPCHFKIKDGKFVKTSFDVSGPIQELYVDRTNKITMSTKYDQSLVTTLSFPEWPLLDLGQIKPSSGSGKAVVDITKHQIVFGKSSCYTVLNIKTSEPVDFSGMSLNGFIDNDYNVNVNIKLMPGTINKIENTQSVPLINIGAKGYTTEISGTGMLILNANDACIGRRDIHTTTGKILPGGSINLKEGTFEFNSIYGPAIGAIGQLNSIDQIEISNKATIKAKVQTPKDKVIGGSKVRQLTIRKDINSIQVTSPDSRYFLVEVPNQVFIEDASKIHNLDWK